MTPDTIGTATVLEPTGLKGRVRPARLIVGAAILIFGAWTSLRYSFGVWGPDADIAAQVVIWQGVLRHGFAFIENWSFTPDNWLFSLSPITALFYTVFGTSPMVVIGVGWLIFVASVGMTARLAHRIAGWRAAFPVAAVLLFSNISTLGNVGFLSYPVSHNISMAWVLLALLLAHHAVARPSAISAIWAGVCVFIDAVSDPWAGPAIALPLVVVSVCLAVLNWRSRKGWSIRRPVRSYSHSVPGSADRTVRRPELPAGKLLRDDQCGRPCRQRGLDVPNPFNHVQHCAICGCR